MLVKQKKQETLPLLEEPDIDSIPGLLQDLDEFIQANKFNLRNSQKFYIQTSGFRPRSADNQHHRLLIKGRLRLLLLREVTAFDLAGKFLGLRGIPLSIAVAGAVAVIVFLIMNWFLRTEIGLALRASGDNEDMVRGMGSNTDTNVLIGCGLSNGLVAMAGALVGQNQGFCDVGMGIGMIVMALAAVIIGEALFQPKGIAVILFSCFAGTFAYRLFITFALRMGMRPGDLKLITSVLVVIALALPFVRKKLRHEWVPPASRF